MTENDTAISGAPESASASLSGKVWVLAEEITGVLYKEGCSVDGKELSSIICGLSRALMACGHRGIRNANPELEYPVMPWEYEDRSEDCCGSSRFKVRAVALDYEPGHLGYVEIGTPKQFLVPEA